MKFVLAALIVGLPLSLAAVPATAQDAPSYARAQNAPDDDAQIRGRISAFDGRYTVRVTDETGYADNVELHEGTIINPTGLTLAPGMIVSILGYNAGPYFAANEIDTPYTDDNGTPFYAGHPWDYYGPSVQLGFFFGNTGWWHGDQFGRENDFHGGAHVFAGGNVRQTYRGGTFQGRAYVASPQRGGYHATAHAEASHGERSH